MRNMINASKYFVTYNESWCDTIVYHTDDIPACKKLSKFPLWHETNKNHWSQDIEDAEKRRTQQNIIKPISPQKTSVAIQKQQSHKGRKAPQRSIHLRNRNRNRI